MYNRFLRVLPTNNKEHKASHTTNGFKRELASGKISELTKWSRNTHGDTQSVKNLRALFFPTVTRSQLILAKLGVPSIGKNPVGVHSFLRARAQWFS